MRNREIRRFLVQIYRHNGDYSAMVPELPGCVVAGDSVEEVRGLISEAILLHLEMMVQSGEKPPEPTRRRQVGDSQAWALRTPDSTSGKVFKNKRSLFIMKGVQYLFDENGKPQSVVIDLKKNRRLWEDFQDLMIAKKRRNDPQESLEEVKAILHKKRKGNGKK
jgi:predicted RNase H-like HicB family nuclease